ncbi:carbohydrate kinase family protein [Aliiglaciecola lipolytica]|uniref:carbohydrate kinase family protein n=1 Tax=Aliiglaciecola lipolytica TaxID=477689 RepID=UPI001C08C383|nr:carbohydrate kinase [Aliiglaciecola lipolytica]MBU2877358.1 carbohydrate kinase [Aliiglaciecola lipolytica]
MKPVSQAGKVICFGEALIDMLSNKVANSIETENETFTKFAGGAPANVSVALAKLGGNSYFCGMLGKDPFGTFLFDSLKTQHVKTDYVLFTEKAKTAIAFVSLDEQGERTFSFYRPPSADLCFACRDFDKQWFTETRIFHFCSNSLTESDILDTTKYGVSLARQHGALISFDVNLRENLWPVNADPFGVIWSMIRDIDVLKISLEELTFLCGKNQQKQTIEKLLQRRCKLIVITDGGNNLQWISQTSHGEIAPPVVETIDATAAGDAFIGGLLFKLQYHIDNVASFEDLLNNPIELNSVLRFASACGAHAASKYGAFPSLPSISTLELLTKEINYELS